MEFFDRLRYTMLRIMVATKWFCEDPANKPTLILLETLYFGTIIALAYYRWTRGLLVW